jgi:hypothetical protein
MNLNMESRLADSVYSGVVSLRGTQFVSFLLQLSKPELWCTDIRNAYLEATSKEKVYILDGLDFIILEGHTLVVFKAIYAPRLSALC